MATLQQFQRNIRRRGKQVEDGIERIMRKTLVAASSAAILATPVDKGRARGGWLSGLNSAPAGEGSPDKSGNSAIARVKATASRLTLDSVGVTANNVPYMEQLNNGSSKQAPANFVRKAVQTGARTVRETRVFDG